MAIATSVMLSNKYRRIGYLLWCDGALAEPDAETAIESNRRLRCVSHVHGSLVVDLLFALNDHFVNVGLHFAVHRAIGRLPGKRIVVEISDDIGGCRLAAVR